MKKNSASRPDPRLTETLLKFSGRLAPLILILLASPVYPLGTFATGQVIIKLTKFESEGIVCESYEAEAQTAGYDTDEECDDKKDECFTPKLVTFRFSIRNDNARVINFMRGNLQKEMLLIYKIHRIEPACLGTSFEVTEVLSRTDQPPASMPFKQAAPKTGSRSFSTYGRIVKLEYQGTAVGTFEGLYYDKTKDKIHPFSITNEEMARYVFETMKYGKDFYIGLSIAILTGFRKSNHDIFEINYRESAGGLDPTPAEAEPVKPSGQ